MPKRLAVAGVVALMAMGSLALWTLIPIAWLWLTRDVRPEETRYVVAVAASAISMLAAGSGLYRLQAAYTRMTDRTAPGLARPGWMRSVSDERAPRRQLSLLEILLAGSAVIAFVVLIGWWAFLADSPNPSGPTAPGTEH